MLGRHCLSSCDNVALSGPAGYVESGWPSQVCRTWLAVTLAQGRLGVSNLLAQSSGGSADTTQCATYFTYFRRPSRY